MAILNSNTHTQNKRGLYALFDILNMTTIKDILIKTIQIKKKPLARTNDSISKTIKPPSYIFHSRVYFIFTILVKLFLVASREEHGTSTTKQRI